MSGGSRRARDYDRILGKLICDRLGLNPNTTAAELTVERIGKGTVWIKTTNLHTIPAEDMVELEALAHQRWIARA
jgi:hypothetical protein